MDGFGLYTVDGIGKQQDPKFKNYEKVGFLAVCSKYFTHFICEICCYCSDFSGNSSSCQRVTHGKFATTLNNIYYRKNQYDIWDFEDSLQHQKVLLVQSRTPQGTIKTAVGESYHYQMVDDFMSYNNLKITANFDRIETYPDTKFTFIIKLLNTRNDSVIFKKESYIISMFHDGHKLIQRQILFKLDNTKLGPSGDIAIPLVIKSPIVPGKYKMLVSIITSNLDPGFNSPAFTLVVKNN